MNMAGLRQAGVLHGSLRMENVAAARVPPGQLRERLLSTLLVSSRDTVAAAKSRPLLQQLVMSAFLAAVHGAGVDLSGPGIIGRMVEDVDEAWLDMLAAAAPEQQRTALLSAAKAAIASQLVSLEQLRVCVGKMRQQLRQAGANICSGTWATPVVGCDSDEKAQALGALQEGCTKLGARPLKGMASGTPIGGEKDLLRWRDQVQLGWPQTAQLFEAAVAAGLSIVALCGRWTRLPKGDPTTASQELLKKLKPKKRAI